MATRDEYADQLRERETPFTAGPPTIVGLIRAVDISTIGDDTAFRHEVRAILDAYDVVMDERLGRLRQRAGRPSADDAPASEAQACSYGRAASCRTPCEGPVDQAVVYISSRHGSVLSREPACRGHADEALSRARGAGTMAKTELQPLVAS